MTSSKHTLFPSSEIRSPIMPYLSKYVTDRRSQSSAGQSSNPIGTGWALPRDYLIGIESISAAPFTHMSTRPPMTCCWPQIANTRDTLPSSQKCRQPSSRRCLSACPVSALSRFGWSQTLPSSLQTPTLPHIPPPCSIAINIAGCSRSALDTLWWGCQEVNMSPS